MLILMEIFGHKEQERQEEGYYLPKNNPVNPVNPIKTNL